ncbi:hypothetical protein [Marinicella rhabdoformis]|uniref:hypothetical protein n=1 Tax=Marinicella rhabdoformis TaxID=2580566 RepID=UPI0012AED99F|nr:hypothetical protein [Marinicella rhabdoformis]
MSYSEIKVSQIELNPDQSLEIESQHSEHFKHNTVVPVVSVTKPVKKTWYQCFIENSVNLMK